MDDNGPTRALGSLILAGLLSPLLLPAPAPHRPRLSEPADPAVAVELGWPIQPDEADPRAWAALPGIGEARASALARAAEEGSLAEPADLLRVRGFGIKMAAGVAGRIRWSPADHQAKANR